MRYLIAPLAAAALVASTPIAYNSAGETQLEKRCSPFENFPTFYANDTKAITYSSNSNWHILTNNGAFDREGTEAYSNSGCASYSFKLTTFGELNIFCGKKVDRGYFDVFVGDTHVGTGDAYDASCSSKCESANVFQYTVPESQYEQTVTVRNRQSDSRLGGKAPYLDVNYAIITPANC